MKKLCSFFLSITIILTSFSICVNAEGFEYKFKSSNDDDREPYCESILMLNTDTDTVVFSMDADKPRSVASLTKIMTYIVAYENIPNIETAVITVPASVESDLANTGSSLAYLQTGEEYTGLELLNLMMVPSGNDAALALSKYFDSLQLPRSNFGLGEVEGGSEFATFIELMNLKADELGCDNTNFMNPHGLYDEYHFSTARDMMKITKHARTLPHFTQITGQIYYTQQPTNLNSESRTVYSTNRLLLQNREPDYFYQYATGIKTGSLTESGYCLASSAVYEGYTYLIIALGSPYVDENGNSIETHGEMIDSKELYKWAFTQLKLKNVATSGQILGDTQLNYAWRKSKIQLACEKDISVILPKEVEISSLITTLDVPQSIDAPITKGDYVGTATLSYADEVVATIRLVAAESVERSEVVLTIEKGKSMLNSGWFKVLAGVIIILVVAYIILMILYNKRRKKRKASKHYRNR